MVLKMDDVIKQLQTIIKEAALESLATVSKSNSVVIERIPGLDFGRILKKGMTP